MTATLDPELRSALAERIRFYNELGIYDFYRREGAGELIPVATSEDFPEPMPLTTISTADQVISRPGILDPPPHIYTPVIWLAERDEEAPSRQAVTAR